MPTSSPALVSTSTNNATLYAPAFSQRLSDATMNEPMPETSEMSVSFVVPALHLIALRLMLDSVEELRHADGKAKAEVAALLVADDLGQKDSRRSEVIKTTMLHQPRTVDLRGTMVPAHKGTHGKK